MFQMALSLDAYAEFLRVEELAERLNRINPKSPITVELVSWNVDENGERDPLKTVYLDVTTQSQARMAHFGKEIHEMFQPASRLEEMLKLEYKPPLLIPAAPVAEDDFVSQALVAGLFDNFGAASTGSVLTQESQDSIDVDVSTCVDTDPETPGS